MMPDLLSLASAWMAWMVPMSWQVGLLVVVIWIACRGARRASAGFRYTLWLLVFAKLLVPPSWSTPWSAGTIVSHLPVRVEGRPLPSLSLRAAPAPSTQPRTVEPAHQIGLESSSSDPYAAPQPAKAHWPMAALAAMVWLCVAGGLFGFFAIQYAVYSRRLARSLSPPPFQIQSALNAAIASMRLDDSWAAQRVSVRVTPLAATPGVVGLLRPMILLPAQWEEDFTDIELRAVLSHELAHIVRRDILVGWFATLLTCIYWFHPAVWVAYLNLRREREMACDDMAVLATKQHGREYAATVLRVAESFDGRVPAGAGLMGMLEVSDNLLQRIRSLGDAGRSRRAGPLAAVMIVLVLFWLPMGAWKAHGEEPAGVEEEIAQHYAQASEEVKEYIRWTAKTFGKHDLWLPENAFDSLAAQEREEKVQYCLNVLDGEYGRHQCQALATAGVLKDPRLLPGVVKAATYHVEGANYDCRAKWIAVEALGRMGDVSAAHHLVKLLDFGNVNTRTWAQASLVRLSGENHGADKKAWGQWWNATGHEPKLSDSDLEDQSPPEQAPPSVPAGEEGSVPNLTPEQWRAAANEEVTNYYAKADPEVQEYIRWTVDTFGRAGFWLPENAAADLSQAKRAERVAYVKQVLDSDYGRHQCKALAEAGVLRDPALLPGVLKAATYHRADLNYDCRVKWIAVAALGRFGDESVIPEMVKLVDHGNQNVRMWARATLVRLTGENFSDNKQSWGEWWNKSGKGPAIDLATLQPWPNI